MVSDEITNDIDGSTVKLHYSAKIPYTYHHDAIYNMTGVEVVDNTFRIENAIPKPYKMSLNSIFGGQYNDITSNYYLGNHYGQYSLEFDVKNRCTASKTLIYPELKYHYVNDSKDSCSFWYPNETRDSVMSLNFKYTTSNNQEYKNNIGKLKINSNTLLTSYSTKTDGRVIVQDNNNSEKESTIDCYYTQVAINQISQSLKQITINSSDPNFIPVTKTVNLRSYQKIDVNSINIDNHDCYKDSVYVKIDSVSEGLHNEYVCELIKDNKKVVSESFVSDTIIKIPANIFVGDERNEIKLCVYDNDKKIEDTGRDKRMFSKKIDINFADTLKIDYNAKELLCHNDFTGEIHINDRSPKNGDYSFCIRDSAKIEKIVADTTFATGLPASTYQMIITDKINKDINGKQCFNDCFFVVVNQPDTLEIYNLIYKDPKCFDYSDGYINYDVKGGRGDYSFLWNDGFSDKNRENIPVGKYSVMISDTNNCQIRDTMILNEPKQLVNYLSGDYRIYTGNSFTVDANKYDTTDIFSKFLWFNEQNNVYSQKSIEEFDSTNYGRYIVVSYDYPKYYNTRKDGAELQCYTTDTLNISLSEERFEKSFLVANQSYFGDSILLVNDSKNDDVDFFFEVPEDMEQSGVFDKFYEYIKPLKPGIYNLIMNIKGKECTANEYREIVVLDQTRLYDEDQLIVDKPQFVSIKMGPNPNNGRFTLDMVLTDNADVSVSLYLTNGLNLIFKDLLTGNNTYNKEYNEDLSVGQYILLVRTESESKVIKFVVTE